MIGVHKERNLVHWRGQEMSTSTSMNGMLYAHRVIKQSNIRVRHTNILTTPLYDAIYIPIP